MAIIQTLKSWQASINLSATRRYTLAMPLTYSSGVQTRLEATNYNLWHLLLPETGISIVSKKIEGTDRK